MAKIDLVLVNIANRSVAEGSSGASEAGGLEIMVDSDALVRYYRSLMPIL
jgi:hypothetical protein